MTRLTRRGFTTGALAVVSGACGGITTRGEDGTELPPAESAPPPPAGFGPASSPVATPPPDPRLAFAPVAANAAPPSVVWSWTTEEQAAELRRDKILFTRESSPTLGRGHLFDLLDARAAQGDAAAARLVGTELAKGRFGWTNPWATVRGATTSETYGHELLAIAMKPDTWYARVLTSRDEIAFVDAAGQPVATATALAAFDRVGGILFEHDVESAASCSTGSGGGGMMYREIYVGSEPRLASVAHRTEAIATVLEDHIRELSALGAWLAGGGQPATGPDWRCAATSSWVGTPGTSLERYLASLAFATPPYAPEATTIDAIVAELVAARFAPDPFMLP